MSAYYNEHDPFAAAWLRELIREGLIPGGDVDERDIQAVQPGDIAGYRQCHFFAGIGGWAYALQLAEWPSGEPVWTGSCPCQPYSTAGKGEGADDARNLWPHWFRLIRECRPRVVFGEQVEAAIRHGWLDAVSTDLEAEGYAFGACVLGAHSVGAPHIRQRVFFVAESTDERYEWSGGTRIGWAGFTDHCLMGDPDDARPQGWRIGGNGSDERAPGAAGVAGWMAHPEGSNGRLPVQQRGSLQASPESERGGETGGTADAEHPERRPLALHRGHGRDGQDDGRTEAHGEPGARGQVRGTWSDLIWLPCRDGKARPAQPGIFPLAHGVRNRVGTLRGAGNAISPQAGEAFVRAYLEASV